MPVNDQSNLGPSASPSSAITSAAITPPKTTRLGARSLAEVSQSRGLSPKGEPTAREPAVPESESKLLANGSRLSRESGLSSNDEKPFRATTVRTDANNVPKQHGRKTIRSFPEKHEVLQLIEAARSGETEQLGQLLQFYFNYLTVLASSELDQRLRKRVSPSDLVQETLLAAHRDFGDFRGESPQELIGWLRQILINVIHGAVAKHVKAGKRDVRREVSMDQMMVSMDRSAANLAAILPGRVESPSSPVHAEERAADLAAHLSQLRPDYRDVIVLRNLRGMSFDQIAEEMERSSGAVRMLWLRAIDKFKATYSPAEG